MAHTVSRWLCSPKEKERRQVDGTGKKRGKECEVKRPEKERKKW